MRKHQGSPLISLRQPTQLHRALLVRLLARLHGKVEQKESWQERTRAMRGNEKSWSREVGEMITQVGGGQGHDHQRDGGQGHERDSRPHKINVIRTRQTAGVSSVIIILGVVGYL